MFRRFRNWLAEKLNFKRYCRLEELDSTDDLYEYPLELDPLFLV